MSRGRWIVALSAGVVLLALLSWQVAREWQIADCEKTGGVWIGDRSRCMPGLKPLIQRDLQRS
jgi:hypothetical protein